MTPKVSKVETSWFMILLLDKKKQSLSRTLLVSTVHFQNHNSYNSGLKWQIVLQRDRLIQALLKSLTTRGRALSSFQNPTKTFLLHWNSDQSRSLREQSIHIFRRTKIWKLLIRIVAFKCINLNLKAKRASNNQQPKSEQGLVKRLLKKSYGQLRKTKSSVVS